MKHDVRNAMAQADEVYVPSEIIDRGFQVTVDTKQLMDFYNVGTIPDLIRAQATHIVNLQTTLKSYGPKEPLMQRVREG